MRARETAACDCSQCQGERLITDTPTDGFKGFQCKPRAEAIEAGFCSQPGSPDTWVVQTAAEVTYERYCYFTCKPIIPNELTTDVSCQPLTPDEIKLQAQTASGNGRAFIYHSNPMTDSLTVEDFPPAPPLIPPMELMKKAFRIAKTAQVTTTVGASCPPGMPCSCNCHCNKGMAPPPPPPPPTPPPPPPTPPPPPPPPPTPAAAAAAGDATGRRRGPA